MLSLFFPFTKIFLGVPSAVVILTGLRVIVPIDGFIEVGIVSLTSLYDASPTCVL